ncbi:MAG: amidohydrolase family protein [Acidobacteria bacterium]|nr:amidohydrolase family protein [Acidobacteriota bacterium]
MLDPGKCAVGWLSLLLLGFVGWARGQQDVPPDLLALSYPDMVLYNGKVLTVDEKFSIAEALAVRDGKILAVGTTDRILKMAGPKTDRVDLQGSTVTPGFIDAHSGQFLGAHRAWGPDWLPNFSQMTFEKLDDGLRMIKAEVEKARPGEWVFVNPFRTAASYQLNRALLDSIAPNNPLMVTLDNTTGMLNSKAISYIPPDITTGIYRDEKGEPTGRISGWAYGVLTYEVIPWPEGKAFEDIVQRQKDILQKINRMGVTSIGYRMTGLATTILKTLYDRGELPLRIRVTSEIVRLNQHAERYLKRIGNLMGVGNEWFKIAGATISSFDPNPETGGMFVRKPRKNILPWEAWGPYGQNKLKESVEPNSGKDWHEYSDYRNALLLGKYGWNVTDMHIQGDAGVELALEIFDKIGKETPVKGKRYGMVHGLMRPQDLVNRLAGYESQLSMAPSLFRGEQATQLQSWYGADEVAGMLPVRDLIDSGLKPILEVTNSAGFVTRAAAGPTQETSSRRTREPSYQLYLESMQAFITRKNATTGKIWGPNQKISREEALRMATSWASRFYFDDKIMGTVEPGKLADLVILGGDFLAVPEEEISKIPVLKVIVGGRVTYEKK